MQARSAGCSQVPKRWMMQAAVGSPFVGNRSVSLLGRFSNIARDDRRTHLWTLDRCVADYRKGSVSNCAVGIQVHPDPRLRQGGVDAGVLT